MLKERLLTNDYYLDQLTLLLSQSYGVPQQVKYYVSLLRNLNQTIDEFWINMGYDKDDLSTPLDINKINDYSKTESDLLDKLAKIYGGGKNMYISYYTNSNVKKDVNVALNNTELYVYIYSQILRNNYGGTNGEMQEFYDKLKTISNGAVDILVYTNQDGNEGGYVIEYMKSDFTGDESQTLNNYEIMFLGGYFTIKSIGISYNHNLFDYNKAVLWDDENTKWDDENCRWG